MKLQKIDQRLEALKEMISQGKNNKKRNKNEHVT